MKKIFALFLSALMLVSSFQALAVESTGTVTSATFTSSTAEIPNPERGFYSGLTGTSPYFYINDADTGSINSAYSNGNRLLIGVLYLGAQVGTDTLPSSLLTNLSAKFALIRAAHMKVIVRPAYNYDSSGTDTTVARMTTHMQQLKSLLVANADVIAFVQTGLVGAYGESHDSATFGNVNTVAANGANFKLIHQAVLANTSQRTTVSHRYPRYPYSWYTTQLNNGTSFSGSDQARTGIHNDCFQADNGDGGTFLSSTLTPVSSNAERLRLSQETNWHPYGGETCDGSATRFTCSTTSGILFDGPTYHMAYLNGTYSTTFISNITSGGCYAQVRRSLGYRFQYDGVSHQSTAAAGQTITVNVSMRNVGWSRIFSERRLSARLMNGSTVAASMSSAVDLRKLPPQATQSTLVPIKLLVAPSSGTYALEICVPDPFVSLQGIADYNVRPGNADSGAQAWNSTRGCWATGTSVVVP